MLCACGRLVGFEADECETNADCGPAMLCGDSGQCHALCSRASDCPTDAFVCPAGICIPVENPDCERGDDCPGTTCGSDACAPELVYCSEGRCRCADRQVQESACGDGLNNDCDSDGADCADPDCDALRCGYTGQRCSAGECLCPFGENRESTCNDGEDNDCDGMPDCGDADCAGRVCDAAGRACNAGECSCVPQGAIETACGNGVDDDCDGAIDCEDPDCGGAACDGPCNECVGTSCLPVDYGQTRPGCDAAADVCTGADRCDGQGRCDPNHTDAGAQTAGCNKGPSPCGTKEECDGSGTCLRNPLPAGHEGTGTGCPPCWDCDGQGACVPVSAGDQDVNCDAEATACSGRDACDGSGVCLTGDVADSTDCPGICTSCSGGECLANSTDHGDCGSCSMCSAGTCVVQPTGSDVKNDCPTGVPCVEEFCAGGVAQCARRPANEDCGTCRRCNAAGQCVVNSTDHTDCTVKCTKCSNGACVAQASNQDLKSECTDRPDGCDLNWCSGLEGYCWPKLNGTDCGFCRECNVGVCQIAPGATADCADCQKCSASGTCVSQTSWEDLGGDCTPAEQTYPICWTGNCNGAGACGESLGTVCRAKAGPCDIEDTCSTGGTCLDLRWSDGQPGQPSCSPYLCTGSSVLCGSQCFGDHDCAGNFVCYPDNTCGVAGQLAQGDACSSNAQCANGRCRDGYCCSANCYSICRSCNGVVNIGGNGVCSKIKTSFYDTFPVAAYCWGSYGCPTKNSCACYQGDGTCRGLSGSTGCQSGADCISGTCNDGPGGSVCE